MRKVIAGLVASVFLALSFSAVANCTSGVVPGTFDIDLGKYDNWNARANTAHCNEVQVDCTITTEHTTVGNTTERANTESELKSLSYKFGFKCLEKAAVLHDKGQKAFVGVYPDDLGYGGILMKHFEAEANRCWNHYFAIYEDLKDKMCSVSTPVVNLFE